MLLLSLARGSEDEEKPSFFSPRIDLCVLFIRWIEEISHALRHIATGVGKSPTLRLSRPVQAEYFQTSET